ncbi:MAG: HEAT repeat domain-containing protein [Dehalococcoidia bacterium]
MTAIDRAATGADIEQYLRNLGSADGTTRHAARVALVTAGPSTTPGLIETLRSQNSDARWEAAKALSELRDPSAAPALVAALTDERPGVRWLAAEALSQMGRSSLDALLHGLVQHSESVWFREGAHHVLQVLAKGDLREVLAPLLSALDSVEPNIGVLVPAHNLLKIIGQA